MKNNMEYLLTERAHLVCPNMCFGIAVSLGKAFEKERVEECLVGLVGAHPFLRSQLGYEKETNSYFYDVKEQSQVEVIFAGELADDDGDEKIIEKFETFTARDWNLFNEGLLKITVWKTGDRTVLLFVFHHLLADGRGALRLVQEFADFYVDGIEPKTSLEHLITKDDLPANSKLSFISQTLVNYANCQWKKENHQLSYEEYHKFADKFLQEDEVKHSLEVVSSDKLTELHEQCKTHKVSINDYLLAKMFAEEKADSIVMACDLRKQLACYNQGALGNYATAFSVKLKQGKHVGSEKSAEAIVPDDTITSTNHPEFFSIAQKVHEQIKKKLTRPKDLYLVLQCYASLEPGLLDAAMLSSRGVFDSKTARFIGTTFFNYDKAKGYSITNLGKIESKNIESAFFIPPASPAIKKTQGVLTVNGVMRICTSQRN